MSALKRFVLKVNGLTSQFGFVPLDLLNLRYLPQVVKDVLAYKKMAGGDEKFPFSWKHFSPILCDYADTAGRARGHYFYQDLWAARKIFNAAPMRHVDIGSRVDGFIAHLLTFRKVEMVDVRPLNETIPDLAFIQDDATQMRTFEDGSVPSLSALHSAEHFGLGRYGDPLDPEACFKFMASLQRVLKTGGRLYFSVPVGVQRLEFNAQRVFAPSTVMEAFQGLELVSFSAVDDTGNFQENADWKDYEEAHFSCGLFEFTKKE